MTGPSRSGRTAGPPFGVKSVENVTAVSAGSTLTAVRFLLLVMLLALGACDRTSDNGSSKTPSGPPTPIGTATVTGTVTFRGSPPPAEEVRPTSDCHAGGGVIEVRPVRIDQAGRLRDVVVFLKGAIGGAKDAPALGGPVLLDQVGCVYVPHAVALRVGQVLTIKSSDATLHNVHSLSVENEGFNIGLVSAGQTQDKAFAKPESFKVKCDVHPWMSAYVSVFDHSWYAITGPDGRYEIRNLPAGRHTLVFRHDFLGETEVEVTVEEGKPATADAAFGKTQ